MNQLNQLTASNTTGFLKKKKFSNYIEETQKGNKFFL